MCEGERAGWAERRGARVREAWVIEEGLVEDSDVVKLLGDLREAAREHMHMYMCMCRRPSGLHGCTTALSCHAARGVATLLLLVATPFLMRGGADDDDGDAPALILAPPHVWPRLPCIWPPCPHAYHRH